MADRGSSGRGNLASTESARGWGGQSQLERQALAMADAVSRAQDAYATNPTTENAGRLTAVTQAQADLTLQMEAQDAVTSDPSSPGGVIGVNGGFATGGKSTQGVEIEFDAATQSSVDAAGARENAAREAARGAAGGRTNLGGPEGEVGGRSSLGSGLANTNFGGSLASANNFGLSESDLSGLALGGFNGLEGASPGRSANALSTDAGLAAMGHGYGFNGLEGSPDTSGFGRMSGNVFGGSGDLGFSGAGSGRLDFAGGGLRSASNEVLGGGEGTERMGAGTGRLDFAGGGLAAAANTMEQPSELSNAFSSMGGEWGSAYGEALASPMGADLNSGYAGEAGLSGFSSAFGESSSSGSRGFGSSDGGFGGLDMNSGGRETSIGNGYSGIGVSNSGGEFGSIDLGSGGRETSIGNAFGGIGERGTGLDFGGAIETSRENAFGGDFDKDALDKEAEANGGDFGFGGSMWG